MKRNKPVYNGENWQDLSVSKVFDLNGITSNYIDDRYSSRKRKVLTIVLYYLILYPMWYFVFGVVFFSIV